MISEAGSGAIWPPDWSTLIPDLGVAIITGLVVGWVILGSERRLERRRLAEEASRLQSRAVQIMRGRVDEPFRYSGGDLMPNSEEIDRAREALAAVPDGRPSKVVPGYTLLVMLVLAADNLDRKADRVSRAIDDSLGVGTAAIRLTLRHVVTQAVAPKSLRDSSDLGGLDLPEMLRSPYFIGVCAEYIQAKAELEATRLGFNEAVQAWDHAFRAIQARERAGGAGSIRSRVWRVVIGNRARVQARKRADQAGRDRVVSVQAGLLEHD